MSYVIVDVESDGPIPAEFSMVCFGAVVFDDRLDRTFYGRTRPISDHFVPEALASIPTGRSGPNICLRIRRATRILESTFSSPTKEWPDASC